MLDFNWTAEAITNVLDNAVKYTPSSGVVELKITEYPSYLRLDISDNGVGIPEEEQAKIFGRFYRGKQSAGIDGVGIGLYLTRDIINKQKDTSKLLLMKMEVFFAVLKKIRTERLFVHICKEVGISKTKLYLMKNTVLPAWVTPYILLLLIFIFIHFN